MKKTIIASIVLVIGFIALSFATFPEVLRGRVVNQSDISGFVGMTHEATTWNKAHPDDPARWTGSMFSGMPTTTMISSTKGDMTQPVYNLLLKIPRPVSYMFISLLGAFLLMLAFGMHPIVAAGGAIAVTFCSYNMQIIQVGHNTKMQAIAFLPWVLAALVFTYRKALQEGLSKRRRRALIALGAALFGVSVSFQVKANHPQISYYLAILILIYVIVIFVWMLARKMQQKYFWIASALLLLLGLTGIATNSSKLLPTWEYTPYSMRGGSSSGEGTGGLDLGYATAWSYGWEELPNLLIPNYNGGSSSGTLSEKSETVKLMRRAGRTNSSRFRKSLPTYWGPQPFTAGPMYMGAVTIFLFIFGLLYWKGKEKWWLAIASLLAVLLALGYHFMPLTAFFYKVMPLYNKFRTVSMILVLLQFTLPLLGFLMLDRIVRGGTDAAVLRRQVFTAGGVTLGLILLLAGAQSLFGTFSGSSDAGQPDILVAALAIDREGLLWADALRSLLFVAAAAAALLWSTGGEKRVLPAAVLVCLLVFGDLFFVGKRYLSSDDFVTPKAFMSGFSKRPVDEAILADTDPLFRVADFTVSIFNDSHASYWHKSIGGYSPAKLQRYQEYIDSRITKDLKTLSVALGKAASAEEAEAGMPYLESLASLNCRYIILSDNYPPLRYPYARGNAWFESEPGSIELTSYTPNRLGYEFSSETGGRAVFSEVYYPAGWVARLDGSRELPIELYAGGSDELGPVAGGILRCIDLPAGEHKLEMSFEPASYARGAAISRASSILLILLTVLSIVFIAVPVRPVRKI